MPNYSAIIIEFEEELERLAAQREQIDRQITSVVKALEVIRTLAEELDEPLVAPTPPPDEAGFTDNVRHLLRMNAGKILTAVEIRDFMLKSRQKDDPKVLLIHTHNTLKRLKKQDEVVSVTVADGRVGYRWKGSTLPDLGLTVTDLLRALQDTNPSQAVGAWAASVQERSKTGKK